MEPKSNAEQLKQVKMSMFINLALAVYAIATLLRALQVHVLWRILLSATGSVFFFLVFVTMLLRFIKLRKAA